MILKALYDYYNQSDKVAPVGKEFKDIAILIVITQDGDFVRFEDTRNSEGNSKKYLVSKSWGRVGTTPQPFHFWDNFSYVMGISIANQKIKNDKLDDDVRKKLEKEILKNNKNHRAFVDYVNRMSKLHPDDLNVKAVSLFYDKNDDKLLELLSESIIWKRPNNLLGTNLSFLIDGEKEIIASKGVVLDFVENSIPNKGNSICLVTGEKCSPVLTFTKIRLGKYNDTKLISFQKNCGFESYGKTQGNNAPISEDAEFKCSTALKKMLEYNSLNKYNIGNRTYVFWTSSQTNKSKIIENSIYSFFCFSHDEDPDRDIFKLKTALESIYNGRPLLNTEGWFYILAIYPSNKARISVSYWAEIPMEIFVSRMLSHFLDMEVGSGNENCNYMGLYSILKAVSFEGQIFGDKSNLPPNLPDSVVKSIFEGLPYPQTLFSSCIRRIRAESSDKDKSPVHITRAAIIKAYLNRLKNNEKKIEKMLDKENNNQGYLCGRLFAVLDKIQEEANNQHSIRERYMNSASSTPAAVFSTILNLSNHHAENLKNDGRKIYFEKLKQEIISKIDAEGFKPQLDLQDQGRFFIGFYHQRQDFFTKNEEKNEE